MAQFFLELLCEEIPARMQKRASDDLVSWLERAFLQENVGTEGPPQTRAFVGPRRLVVVVDNVHPKTLLLSEERKGPRLNAPEAAIQGFLRGAGLDGIDQAQIRHDPKGDFYVAVKETPARETIDLLPGLLESILRQFPWPKAMRSRDGDFLWVRPLQSILCLFDGQVVPWQFEGLTAGRVTQGHRFHAPEWFEVQDFEDYQTKLAAHFVVLDREERKARIVAQCRAICDEAGLEWIEDAGLLEEVTGLVEWPVAIMGDMHPDFLSLPPEVIQTSMRSHQKFFALRNRQRGTLAAKFITIANIDAKDGGAAIAAGNQRVLSARLDDARYFYELDKKLPLANPIRQSKLKSLVFHEKLGSMFDKAERISILAGRLAAMIGADKTHAERAGLLAKFDLVAEMVGEFPELQGVMGQYYARAQGEPEAVAQAIAQHYRPQGPNDQLPERGIAACVALADKLDSLTGFWLIGETPTGSGDPYALRRAALGVLRILMQYEIELDLGEIGVFGQHAILLGCEDPDRQTAIATGLRQFFQDRLIILLRDEGYRLDWVRAVLGRHNEPLVPFLIGCKIAAFSTFLETKAGQDLLSLTRRAGNLLEAEIKKDRSLVDRIRLNLFLPREDNSQAETALHAKYGELDLAVRDSLDRRDYAGAMSLVAQLREPLDRFLETVLVNDPDPAIRLNRLHLLSGVQEILLPIADFSQIERK